MKFSAGMSMCALAAACLFAAPSAGAQEKAAPAARQMSTEETRQANDVASVSTATQKLKLLTDFLAAHPASLVRGRLLTHVGVAIGRESDAAVRVSLAEQFIGLMSSDLERRVASEILTDAYLKANRVDDAFQTIAVLPTVELVDVRLLARLTAAGADQARQRNLKHLAASRRYGQMAIRAIEADQRPVTLSAMAWKEYKGTTLPAMYQSLGLLSLHASAPAEAITHLQKAVELAPNDPLNYVFLGAATNEEYSTSSQQLKQMQPGPARDAMWKKSMDLLNQVVDSYARALALSAGSPQEQAIRVQVRPDLEGYFKFLHNGSLEGLQAFIDKYKKQ